MKRIIVKIGTAVLTNDKGQLDEDVIQNIVRQICKLLRSEKEILIISSGAIGAGMWLLNVKKRPSNLAELQSLAAIGQTRLMDTYNKYFTKRGYLTGQILLTQDDFDDRRRFLNIKYTITTLLKQKVVPIINENDTTSTEEIKCGDNDRISSLVADAVRADTLIMLTDVKGLMDRHGNIIREVDCVTDDIRDLVKKKCAGIGTGGMYTKINAADCAVKAGIECYIARGKDKDVLLEIVQGKGEFTHFKAVKSKVTARKRWIGFGSKVKGSLVVDDGAREALIVKHKSLLSAGIVESRGNFNAGDILGICDEHGREIARGITNYSSVEIKKIRGVKTKDIESILGYKDHDEVIHRDNLIIL